MLISSSVLTLSLAHPHKRAVFASDEEANDHARLVRLSCPHAGATAARNHFDQYGGESIGDLSVAGHSDISITPGIYGHVFPSMQKDVADKWQDAFAEKDEDEDGDESGGVVPV